MPASRTQASRLHTLAAAAALFAALFAAPGPASAQTSAALATATPTTSALVTYQVVGLDTRKCAFPFCGGYYVKAVNQALTRCADGKWATRCHAVTLDTTGLGWTAEQQARFDEGFAKGQALVIGTLATGTLQGVQANVLSAVSAWQGQTLKTAKGSFYSLRDTGIRCIVAPCPSLEATLLNTSKGPVTTDLDLSTTGATDEQIAATGPALASSGVLVAGTIVPTTVSTVTGRTTKVNKLVATEFYLPAKP